MTSRADLWRDWCGKGVVAVSALALFSGCAGSGSSEEAAQQAAQALGGTQCAVNTDCSLTLLTPSGIDSAKVAVAATGGVVVGSGSTLSSSSGAPVAVVGVAGEVRVEAGARVGTVWTKGKAFVGGNAVVSSALYATTTEIQAGANAPPRQAAQGSPTKVSWNVKFPATTLGNVNLEPGTTQTLAPGRYGTLRIASRATLKLQTGPYYFESLLIEPDATLQIDNRTGTALVYVRADFTHRGHIVALGTPSDAIFGVFSTGVVELGDEFDATLVAPYAQITLAQPRTGSHDGQYFGRSIQINGGVRIKATPSTASGPTFGGIVPQITPSSGGALPGPVPSPDGLTFEQWQDAKNAYIQKLIDSGYSGETVHLPVHPDAAKVRPASDFAVPSNSTLAQASAPAIPTRDTGVFPNPGAEQELRNDITTKETAIVAQPRFGYLGQPESTNTGTYGTPPKVEDVPKKCVFSAAQMNDPPTPVDKDGKPIGSLDAFKFQDLISPVILGNKPDYLVPAPAGLGFNFDKSKAPQYDGYWFFDGRLMGGWNGVGMEGQVGVGLYAGIVALKHHVELVHFALQADGALMKELPSGEVKPYFSSTLETKLLGKQFDFLPNWDVKTNDPAFAKLKKNLLDRTVLMFPDDAAPRVQVGPFALILNGGAEVKIPLALDLDAAGPEVTISPMFRVYITVFAGIDIVIAQIGLKGEADVIRVDMPFKAKLKWRDYLNPESCYSSADFDVTFQSIWSTLNGNLKVSVKAKLFGFSIDIVDEEIVSWKGLSFDTGETNLLPTLQLPLMQHKPEECDFAGNSCFEKATARVTNVPDSWTEAVPYTNPECPNQHVYEVDMQGRNLNELWLRTLWDISEINTQELCEDSVVRVTAFRQKADNSWDRFDSYMVKGVWQAGACQTSSGGKISATENNTAIGFPWSWVDTSAGVKKVRVAVAGGSKCDQRSLKLGVAESSN
jgi:hypothetical protein